jgi:hypothetical protein
LSGIAEWRHNGHERKQVSAMISLRMIAAVARKKEIERFGER